MKVIAINGSPRAGGNTHDGIEAVAAPLRAQGIEVEEVHVGALAIRGCTACGGCRRAEDGLCVLEGDIVRELTRKIREADGVILGSPVYYGGINGTLKALLDRVFFSSARHFRFKVGAAVVAVRRGGGTSAFFQLSNYFSLSNIIVAPGHYWNVVHGTQPGEAVQDGEGMQVLRTVGANMAWLLHTLGAARDTAPQPEARISTNFIR